MAGNMNSGINGFYSQKFDKRGNALSDSAVYSPRSSVNDGGNSDQDDQHSDMGAEVRKDW
jgi:hypothetical protein